jgi:hypothetical protein
MRTRLLQPFMSKPMFFEYSPESLRRFVHELHGAQLERYQPLKGTPKVDKAFCRWTVLQLAPAILVDGAWLAGIPSAAEMLGDQGRHLLKIYADELGSGHPERNHPNVYRRLLESLDLDVPPFDSEAFANHPGFLNAAFDIPVYLLAIGLQAGCYFPELLGLNLAIELSGLGASYMRAIDILRHHGIDPAIIQLHLSIDNPASGHAALARSAVELHLEETRRREGPEVMQAIWRRIWWGYRSLNIVSLSLGARISARYVMHRLAGRLH